VDEGAIAYWCDKSGRELDFVIKRPGRAVDVLECKVDPGRFDPDVLKVFRSPGRKPSSLSRPKGRR